jgi:TolB protein
MPMDASKPERICDGDQAEWSPDGAKIAFRRNEGIFTRDLATGEEKKISPEDWPHCSGPSWSPDGKTIAFACRWEAGNGIFLVGADGGQPKKVYDKQGACEPHWSRDGKRIVYETETHICSIAADGTNNRPITYFGGVQRYARYSPDGKCLIFCQGASEKGPWELYVIPSEGGTPERLTEGGSDMHADWK